MYLEELLNSGLKNHKENNLEGAENYYTKILKKDSKNFNALYLLGTIFFQKKKFDKAIKSFESAILINPNHAELCNNYGATLIQTGEYKKSINYFQKAIKIKPNYAQAYNNFGSALKELNEHKKSLTFYEKAIQIEPNLVDPYLNQGIVFKELGDFEKAIFYFSKTLNIHPENIKGHQNLMESYEKTNQEKNFQKAVQNAKTLIKDNPIVKLYESIILYNSNKFTEAKDLLEKISFNADDMGNEGKRVITLAQCYDRIGDSKNAFKNFSTANNIFLNLRTVNFFDKNRYLKIIDDRISFFAKTNIKNWTVLKLSSKRPDPIFLIGFPRSGTTLIDTILNSHPSVEVIEEKPMVGKLIESLAKLPDGGLKNLEKINEANTEKLKNIYFNFLDKQIEKKSNHKTYIDKFPLNIVHVGEIFRMFPNAKFIVALRHPYDCVLSCFMQNFELNDAMANFFTIEDSAKLYDSVMSLWVKYLSIFKIKYHNVKYENLIKEFNPTIQSILSFLELPWDDSVLKYSRTAQQKSNIATPSYKQVIKPIYSYASGRWKRYENEMQNVNSILEKWVNKFDY